MSLASFSKPADDNEDDDVQESLPQLVEKLRKKIGLKGKSFSFVNNCTNLNEYCTILITNAISDREK